jgi:hypothetical protein
VPTPGRPDEPRRALLALPVALAPLLQITGMVPHPVLPHSAAGALAVVAQDPAQWWRMHLLAACAAFLFALAAAPLASLVRGGGAEAATAGAALLALGGAALTVAFSAEAHLWSLAADASLEQDALVGLVALEASSPAMALLGAGFPLIGLGTVLLMTGLLRSGQVPRWQPALVLLGTVASLGAAPGSDLGPLLLSPAALGYVFLARQVLLPRDGTSAVGASSAAGSACTSVAFTDAQTSCPGTRSSSATAAVVTSARTGG